MDLDIDIDTDASNADDTPQETLPNFRKTSTIRSTGLPPHPVAVVKSDEEILAAMNAELAIVTLNLKEAIRNKAIITMQLGNAHAGQNEARQIDLATAKELHTRLSTRCLELKTVIAEMVSIQDESMESNPRTFAANASSDSSAPIVHGKSANGIRIKIPTDWPTYSRDGELTAYDFFDAFLRKVVPVLEQNTFEQEGHTYLTLLMRDTAVQDLLIAAFKRHRTHTTINTENSLERVFFDTCLTKEERSKAVDELLKIGMKPKETYLMFSARILQILRRLHFDRNDKMTLDVIKACIPVAAINLLNRSHNELMLQERKPIGPPATIAAFCAALSTLEGPDPGHYVTPLNRGGMLVSKSLDQWCNTCNKRTNHDTDNHVMCEYCNKPGHSLKQCHIRKKEEDKRRGTGRNHSDRRPHDRQQSTRDRHYSSRDRSPRRDKSPRRDNRNNDRSRNDRYQPYHNNDRRNNDHNDDRGGNQAYADKIINAMTFTTTFN
ncbi:MAG: hypothetical protein J3R72DRAFT_426694 [Linnemannia gamsii]|nr:MAG: hypothetical protein J3R72DRAFT_426694 [Linnemannia gamsii]